MDKCKLFTIPIQHNFLAGKELTLSFAGGRMFFDLGGTWTTDHDEEGNLVGIEVLDASKRVAETRTMQFHVAE